MYIDCVVKSHRDDRGFILSVDGEQIGNMCCGAPIYYKRVIEIIERKRDSSERKLSMYEYFRCPYQEKIHKTHYQLNDKTGAPWL